MRDDAAEIRRLYGEIDRMNGRLERVVMKGRVHAVEGDRVRLMLRERDEATGKEFLSPWVRWQGQSGSEAGGFSLSIRPAVGERMQLFSPSGDIGSSSLAVADSFTDDAPSPDEGADMILKRGDTLIEMSGDGIRIMVGEVGIAITASEVVTMGRTRLNNGTSRIGRVGDRDNAGHPLVQGAASAFA